MGTSRILERETGFDIEREQMMLRMSTWRSEDEEKDDGSCVTDALVTDAHVPVPVTRRVAHSGYLSPSSSCRRD